MRRYSTTRRAPPAPGRTLDDGEDSAGGRGKWSGAMGYLSRSVFRDRLARIREALGEADLAALVVLTPENFLYVSGYFLDVQPWERPVAAVVPRDEDPFLIMHELSTNHVRYANEHESMWIREVHFYAEHYRLHRRTYLTPQWPQMAADLLRRKGLGRGRYPGRARDGRGSRAEVPGVQGRDPGLGPHRAEFCLPPRDQRGLRPGRGGGARHREHRHPAAQRVCVRERAHLFRRDAHERAGERVRSGRGSPGGGRGGVCGRRRDGGCRRRGPARVRAA